MPMKEPLKNQLKTYYRDKEIKDQVKEHWEKNKIKYYAVGAFILGAGITTFIMKRGSHAVLAAGADCLDGEAVDSLFVNVNRSTFNAPVTVIHNSKRGHPGFLTKCLEDELEYQTQGLAAKAYGIPESILSKHLNEGRELLEDLHFERVPAA